MDINMTWFADIKTFFIDRGTSASFKCLWILLLSTFFFFYVYLYNPTVRRLEALPGKGGGGPMSPVWILKRLVSVFINACHLLSALPSLSQFSRGRLSLVVISFYALAGPQVSLNSPGEKKPNLCYFREGVPAHHVHVIGDAQLGFEVMSLKCETCKRKEKSEIMPKMPGHVLSLPKKGEHKFLLLIWSSHKHLMESSWIK